MNLIQYIKDVKDFPAKGIVFKDISPLLANGEALRNAIEQLSSIVGDCDLIIGPEARGFIFGVPVAFNLTKPFVMVRKKDKLPGDVISIDYELEYQRNTLEIQKGLIKPNQKVVIIDDVLATGGTTNAMIELVNKFGAKVVKVVVLLQLDFLNGDKNLKAPSEALIHVK